MAAAGAQVGARRLSRLQTEFPPEGRRRDQGDRRPHRGSLADGKARHEGQATLPEGRGGRGGDESATPIALLLLIYAYICDPVSLLY